MHEGRAVLAGMPATELPWLHDTCHPTRTPRAAPDDPTSLLPQKLARSRPLFDPEIVSRALRESFVKLNPATLAKNPVMFVVEVGAALTTVFVVARHRHRRRQHRASACRSRCGCGSRCCLRTSPKRWRKRAARRRPTRCARPRPTSSARRSATGGKLEQVPGSQLRAGDVVFCEAGDIIPGDGEVIEGIATVDESVITGESAPVIRESGGDRSAVTGGTRVLSDRIKVRITSNPGETFLDRMIALVEGAAAPEDAE